MSTSPSESLTPGVVTFTAQGNRALIAWPATWSTTATGPPTSIADVLERVLSVDIAELADALGETTTRASSAAQLDVFAGA